MNLLKTKKNKKNFGIDLSKDKNIISKAGAHIFVGYKPKPRGCKKRNNWICVLYGDMV